MWWLYGREVHVAVWLCLVGLLHVDVEAYKRGARKKAVSRRIVMSAEAEDAEMAAMPKVTYDGWTDPCFYSSMNSILNVWRSSTAEFGGQSNSFVSLFINKCFSSPTSWDERDADRNRKPFITIESYSHKMRDSIAKSVAKAIKGQFLTNPPRCMVPVRYIYGSRSHHLHRPYMAIAQYGSSHSAKSYWVHLPVVMTGYWYDHRTSTLTDLFLNNPTPPATSHVYQFPRDLNVPDLTVFINVKDTDFDSWEDISMNDPRGSPAWMAKYTDIILNFPNSTIHEVKWTGAENVITNIINIINDKLNMQNKF